jgi:hypothetical protein
LIALDARLGCLEPNLAEDSDAQRMINAVVIGFDLAFDLEIKMPFLMKFRTPAMKRFIKYQEDVLE